MKEGMTLGKRKCINNYGRTAPKSVLPVVRVVSYMDVWSDCAEVSASNGACGFIHGRMVGLRRSQCFQWCVWFHTWTYGRTASKSVLPVVRVVSYMDVWSDCAEVSASSGACGFIHGRMVGLRRSQCFQWCVRNIAHMC